MRGLDPASDERPRRAALRVVTWNIHKCIGGVDRLYRPERVVEVLRAIDADVVLLQEVDEDVPRSRHDRQVDLIGDALDYGHRAFFPHKRLRRGHYGNAILSRLPLDHAETFELTRRYRIPRAALHVRFTCEAGGTRRRVWLYNVHLGLEESERKDQLDAVLRWHAKHNVATSTAVVVAGDFNDVWNSLGTTVLAPAGFHGIAERPRTFPAFRPIRPLDAAFVRGPLRIARAGIAGVAGARTASDHLPLAFSLRPC